MNGGSTFFKYWFCVYRIWSSGPILLICIHLVYFYIYISSCACLFTHLNNFWFSFAWSFSGKMFRTLDLPVLTQFLLIFQSDKPCDWLLDHFVQVRVCRFDMSVVCMLAVLTCWCLHSLGSIVSILYLNKSLKINILLGHSYLN